MDSIAAQRRLKAIHGHLAVDGDSFPQLRPNLTAGEFFIGTLSLSLSLSDMLKLITKSNIKMRSFAFDVQERATLLNLC